jgi:hypothetical protein
MNRDIRLSVGFFDHPKIIKLERQLGHEGVIALMRLWLWAAQNRPSGLLSGMDDEDIAIAARWNGDATAFKDFITCLKLLDTVGDVYQIHDWQEHNTWQSDAENRSNASRLSRMAKTHPEIYKILEDAGIKGISREVYGVITTSNDPKAAVERLLTTPSSPFLSFPFSSSPCLSSPFREEERETSLRSVSLSEPDGPDAQTKNPSEKKPRNTKSAPEPLPEDSEPYRLAVLMRDTLKANVPTLKKPDLRKWARSFDVALRNDERMEEPPFVAEVIKWACSDLFWRANIQSPDKLRKQFDQLTAKMESEAGKARTASKAGKWVSPAQRRVEGNQAACDEAERLLFGQPPQGVTYDAS